MTKIKRLKKFVIIFSIASIITTLVYIFIPSKEYIYAKGIAENISNNQTFLSNTIDDTINKIITAAEKIGGNFNADQNSD